MPLSSLQSLHVREAQRHKVQVCASLCRCVIIRNVIKMSEGLCAFRHVVVITARVRTCVCLYRRSRKVQV